MRFKIFFLFSVLSFNLLAATVDLDLTMNFTIQDGVYFDQTGEFSVVVRNNGPDIAGLNSPSDYPIFVKTVAPIELLDGVVDVSFFPDLDKPQNCIFFSEIYDPPPNTPFINVVYTIGVPQLAPNTSVVCYGKFLIGFNSGSQTIKWQVNSNDTDINSANDEADIVFGIRPQIVPTLSPLSLVALLLLVLMLAYLFFLKTRKTATFL